MCNSLSRRCWSPLFCERLSPSCPSTCADLVRSTTNGSAKTSGASKTVNGYLIFILYSVFLLARALSSLLYEPLAVLDAYPPFLQSFAL
jgi:hypothetical protein